MELGERKGNLSDIEGGAFWLKQLHRVVATIGPCRTDKDGCQGQGQGAKRSQSRVWSGQSACQEQAPSVPSTLLLLFSFFFPEKAKERSNCYCDPLNLSCSICRLTILVCVIGLFFKKSKIV